MEGLLLEKCMERGLTLPYRGGDVVMKSFIDSLSHACKVPNTDQVPNEVYLNLVGFVLRVCKC